MAATRLDPAAAARNSDSRTLVHMALWRLANGAAEVCATIRQIVLACGLAEHVVRRELAALVEAGAIVPNGKRGKTTVFRLSPATSAAEPRRDATPPTESSSSSRSTADSRHGVSPMEQEDREHLDNFEWTPELLADYRAKAEALAERYSSRGSPRKTEHWRRRDKLPDEPLRRGPDLSERAFERGRSRRRRPEIWLPLGARTAAPGGV